MATTGAPWNIPYVEPTDIPRTYPEDSEDLALAIAAGLSAAGGLVEVKSAIFAGTQTNSTAGGANFAVTDLTITHEVADAANKLIISAFLGVAASAATNAALGIAVHDGTGLIVVGDAEGSRTRMTAGGNEYPAGSTSVTQSPSITFVHTPGSGSKTYTLRAINLDSATHVIYINRSQLDNNGAGSPRAVSSLVIQEVKV